jgi:hypothetical protein
VAYKSKIPLSYFSDGQEVPGSLKPASLDVLVERIFNCNGADPLKNLPPEELALRRRRFEILMEEGIGCLYDESEELVGGGFEQKKTVNLRI